MGGPIIASDRHDLHMGPLFLGGDTAITLHRRLAIIWQIHRTQYIENELETSVARKKKI